jgi:hypothetical protein
MAAPVRNILDVPSYENIVSFSCHRFDFYKSWRPQKNLWLWNIINFANILGVYAISFLAFAGGFYFPRDISFHAYKYITAVVHFGSYRWLPYSSEAPETISLTLPTPVSLRRGNSRNCTWWMTSLRTWGWLPSSYSNQLTTLAVLCFQDSDIETGWWLSL